MNIYIVLHEDWEMSVDSVHLTLADAEARAAELKAADCEHIQVVCRVATSTTIPVVVPTLSCECGTTLANIIIAELPFKCPICEAILVNA